MSESELGVPLIPGGDLASSSLSKDCGNEGGGEKVEFLDFCGPFNTIVLKFCMESICICVGRHTYTYIAR